MRLLRDVPEIEESINKGELTITHLNFAQTLFRQEKKIHNVEMSHEQKISVIEQITNKSTREAEVIMLSLSSAPEKIKPDRVRAITEKRIEMKFSANAEVEDKVERLKGMLAHKHPNLSLGELFEKLCDLGLEEWSPAKIAAPRKRRSKVEQSKDQSTALSKAQIRREVFARANNQCENYHSSYALEIDHIRPQAIGGLSPLPHEQPSLADEPGKAPGRSRSRGHSGDNRAEASPPLRSKTRTHREVLEQLQLARSAEGRLQRQITRARGPKGWKPWISSISPPA